MSKQLGKLALLASRCEKELGELKKKLDEEQNENSCLGHEICKLKEALEKYERNIFRISCLSCRSQLPAIDCQHSTCTKRGTHLTLDDDPCEEWLPSKTDVRNKLKRIKAPRKE